MCLDYILSWSLKGYINFKFFTITKLCFPCVLNEDVWLSEKDDNVFDESYEQIEKKYQ